MKNSSMKDLLMISLSDELTYQDSIDEYVKICPKGFVDSTKGNFLLDEESIRQIENWQKHRGIDIVIDYEHQTLDGDKAPAAGWIKSLKTESDGLYAQIEWTEAAKQHLKNKEYRYFSPVVLVRKSDQRAVRLHSVALTNTPAINKMTPIINSENHTTLLEALISLLGLPDGTTEEEVIKAINGLQSEMNEVLTSLKDTTISVTEDSTPSKMVYALKEQLKEKDEHSKTEKVDSLIESLLNTGKIIPAQVEVATRLALSDREALNEFVKYNSMRVPMGPDNPPLTEHRTYHQNKFSEQLGISQADIDKYSK